MTNFGFFPLNLKKQQKPLERKKCQVSIFCNEICQAMLKLKLKFMGRISVFEKVDFCLINTLYVFMIASA